METRIEELIAKYNEGLADPSEIKLLEKLIEEGTVSLTQLQELNKLDEQIVQMEQPSPSMKMEDQFYAKLAAEKKKIRRNVVALSWPDWSALTPRLAFASVLLVAGFVGGYFLQSPGENKQVRALTQQVGDLKEMVMLSLLEKESATDRLRAVSLTGDMNQVSQNVIRALFKTLNEDDNVNVRLAALEELKSYVRDGHVREELVRSISKQESPMVQVELAELMVTIQEKKSVKALQRILENEKTPKEVKSKIEESIRVLI
jgi:hypothetical protein